MIPQSPQKKKKKQKSRARDHEVHIVNSNTGILEVESAEFTVCTSRFGPSLIHGLCAIFASKSRFMRLFQAALDTCLDNPPSLPASQFTVCTSRFTRPRNYSLNLKTIASCKIGAPKTAVPSHPPFDAL